MSVYLSTNVSKTIHTQQKEDQQTTTASAHIILYIKVCVLSLLEHCAKQKATLSNQIKEGNEKENISPPSEGEKSTEKGECLDCLLLHIHHLHLDILYIHLNMFLVLFYMCYYGISWHNRSRPLTSICLSLTGEWSQLIQEISSVILNHNQFSRFNKRQSHAKCLRVQACLMVPLNHNSVLFNILTELLVVA